MIKLSKNNVQWLGMHNFRILPDQESGWYLRASWYFDQSVHLPYIKKMNSAIVRSAPGIFEIKKIY